MFGKRTQDFDNMARAAWHDVVDTLSSSEAGKRAGNAWDALAGRSSYNRAWPMMRAAAVGVVIGWVGAEIYRRRRTHIDDAVDRVGAELRERASDAKQTVDEQLGRAKAAVTPANARTGMGTGTNY